MSVLKNFRALARYHVLTPVAVLAALAAGQTVAADKVNNGTIAADTVTTGFGYINNGTINGNNISALLSSAGDVTTVVNNGTISNGLGGAVRFNGNVVSFVNNGAITGTNSVIFDPGPGETTTVINRGSIVNNNLAGGNALDFNGDGNVVVVNSGALRGRETISFDDIGDDTLTLLTGSELYRTGNLNVLFDGGADTFDFSGFYGTTSLRVRELETIIAGSRAFAVNGDIGSFTGGTVTIFDQTGASSMGSVTSGSLGSIQTALANELGGFSAGNLFDPNAVSGYAAAPRQTSAEKAANEAVLSDLDVSDPSQGKVWGTAFGGVSGDSAPVALSNVYGGIVAGTHFQLDAQTRLGGLVGYSMSKFNVANGQQVIDSHTGTLGVYGKTDLGMIELNYALLGGGSSHSSSRQVVVGANKENATASFASWFINPSLGLSIPVMSDDTSEINVAASASYIYGGVGSYTESSANFTAAVGAVPISVFEARLELNGEKIIAPTAHGDVRIRGKVGVLAEANMGSSNIPLTLNGTATTFANPGTTTYGAYVGAGLSADIGSGLVLDAGVDFTARADGNNAASGKVSLIGSF